MRQRTNVFLLIPSQGKCIKPFPNNLKEPKDFTDVYNALLSLA